MITTRSTATHTLIASPGQAETRHRPARRWGRGAGAIALATMAAFLAACTDIADAPDVHPGSATAEQAPAEDELLTANHNSMAPDEETVHAALALEGSSLAVLEAAENVKAVEFDRDEANPFPDRDHPDTAPLPPSTSSAITQTCKNAAISCAASSTTALIGCLGSLESIVGVLVACIPAGGFAIAQCQQMKNICGTKNTAQVNRVKGFKGQHATNEVITTKNCAGEGRVWAAYMHTTTVTAVSNKVVSGLTLYCTGGDKLTFGTTASADLGSSCGVQGAYMMQGFNTFSGIYVDSLGPRCDPMFDITKADWYGLQRGGTGGTSGSLLCDEGEYMAGAKVYRVNTANGYVFNGISLMCREPQ